MDFLQNSKDFSLSLVFPCLSGYIIAKTLGSSKQNSVLISVPFGITGVRILFVTQRLLRLLFKTPFKHESRFWSLM